MVGSGPDWWNCNTPEDNILMQLVEIAKKLVHLPQLEEIPEKQRRSLAGNCVTYFGSFEGARKKAAKLLYGHVDLTCPGDLLPSEARLSPVEQEEIRERRRSYYQEMLKKLSEPDALAKMRRERAEEEKRRKYQKETAGYTVRQIPIQTRREMREVIGEEELLREAKSTSGLFARRPEKQKPATEGAKSQKEVRLADNASMPELKKQKTIARKRRVTSFREQWEKSSLNPANHPKTTTGRPAPSAKMDSQGLADHPKSAPEQSPLNVRLSADCSKTVHEQPPPNVRECPHEQADHLELAPEQLVQPLAELLMQQLQGATITIEGGNDEMNWWDWNAEMLKQLKDAAIMIEGGSDEMARPKITMETILNALSGMVDHYGHLPTGLEMAEYSNTHEDEYIPGLRVMSRSLGPKDTWMAQLEEYLRSKRPEPSGAPGDSPDGGLSGPASDSPGGASPDSMPGGEAAGGSGATPGSEPEPEDDTKTYHGADGLDLLVPSAKVVALDLNLQSVQLNFRLNGQDYTMRLRFGES